jgi:hypothetical protein
MKTRGHVDATTPLQVHVIDCDVEKGDPRNSANCAVAVAAKRQYRFEEFIVYRTISYGLKPGDEKYLRWQNSGDVLEFLKQYDINKKIAKKRLPPEGFTVSFWPPRYGMSSAKLNSDLHRQQVNNSHHRRKGKLKRQYRITDPLTLQGVRWGTKEKT